MCRRLHGRLYAAVTLSDVRQDSLAQVAEDPWVIYPIQYRRRYPGRLQRSRLIGWPCVKELVESPLGKKVCQLRASVRTVAYTLVYFLIVSDESEQINNGKHSIVTKYIQEERTRMGLRLGLGWRIRAAGGRRRPGGVGRLISQDSALPRLAPLSLFRQPRIQPVPIPLDPVPARFVPCTSFLFFSSRTAAAAKSTGPMHLQ